MNTPYISQQPVDDFGLRQATVKYSAALNATTDTTLTIPDSAPRYKAVISVGGSGIVWFSVGATAAVPAGATFASTTSELVSSTRTICREVKNGEVLHFYTSTATTEVSVALYALGTNN